MCTLQQRNYAVLPVLFIALALVMFSPGSAEAGLFTYKLSMQVEGCGTTNPAPGNHEYNWFAHITTTATPYAGWKFSRWEITTPGDLTHNQTGNPRTTVMYSDKTIKAVFTPAVPADAALVSPDGIGFLRVLHDDPDDEKDKLQIQVEGSAYQMGYQHGYLLAERVNYQTSDDFFKDIVSSFGVDIINTIVNDPNLYNPIMTLVKGYVLTQSTVYCTPDMRSEMYGIANGASDRLAELGYGSDLITYDRVVLENLAFDALLGIFYPIITSEYMTTEEAAQFWLEFLNVAHMCDGFVATNSATATNGTLMARSFQLDPSVTRMSAVIQYYPDKGNNFVAVNPPGFVGTCVAMNEHGVAIGNDMVPTIITNPIAFGIGTQLTARKVMQFCNNTSDAVDTIKNSVARGVPWAYIIGDKSSGVIAEAAATLLPGGLPSQADYFAARWTDYVLADGAHPEPVVRQIEFRDDLVGVANHYMDPTVYSASGQSIGASGNSSITRYELVVNEALDAIAAGGITVDDAIWTVSHQVRTNDPSSEIHGINAVFDMEMMTIHAQWNQVGTPWVSYTMPGFGASEAYTVHSLPGLIEAEDYDQGGPGIGYLDTTAGNVGGEYRSDDVDIAISGEGGYLVGWTEHDEWLNYTLHDVEDGLYTIQVRVATPHDGRGIAVSEPHVRSFGLKAVPNTGGWRNWTTVEYHNVYLHSGMSAVRIRVDGGLININYLNFIRTGDFEPAYTTHKLPGIIEAEDFDNGGHACGFYDLSIGNAGGQYRFTDTNAVDIETCSEGGYNVGWTAEGEWLNYTLDRVEDGYYTIQFRTACWVNDCALTLSTPDTVLGTVGLPNTGGVQNWTTVELTNVYIPANAESLRLSLDDGCNITKMTFNKTASVANTYSFPENGHKLPGTIEAEDYDIGDNGVAYSDSGAGNNGNQYRSDDVDITTCAEGGYQVGWTANGEWLQYTLDSVETGTYDIDLNVSGTSDVAAIQVSLDGVILGTVAVANTGGYQIYETVGLQDVYIDGAAANKLRLTIINDHFDIDNIRFIRKN